MEERAVATSGAARMRWGQQLIEAGQIAGGDLQDQVGLPGQLVALHHFIQFHDAGTESLGRFR